MSGESHMHSMRTKVSGRWERTDIWELCHKVNVGNRSHKRKWEEKESLKVPDQDKVCSRNQVWLWWLKWVCICMEPVDHIPTSGPVSLTLYN